MKCQHPDGAQVFIGEHELDPCLYEEVEKWENVTVTILKCKRCGHIEIEWQKQEDTIRLL